MLAVLLTSAAMASGVLRPDISLVDPGCAEFAEAVAAEWPHRRDIRITGLVRGSTSAPGGPVSHHVFSLEPDGLMVTRQGCRHPEPGQFTVVGQCGGHNLLRFSGDLRPGETYWIGPELTAWLTITTAGTSAHRDCPPPPPEPGYVDERTLLKEEALSLTLPADAVSYDQGWVTIRAEAVAEAVGLEHLRGQTTLSAARPVESPAQAQVTVRWYRHVFDEEDGMGGAWCTTQQEAEVTVSIGDPEVAFVFHHDGDPKRRDGACPQ